MRLSVRLDLSQKFTISVFVYTIINLKLNFKKRERVVAVNGSDGYLKVVVWGFQKTHMPLKKYKKYIKCFSFNFIGSVEHVCMFPADSRSA